MTLGLIEGFYGTPWGFEARADTIARLAPQGYGFYIYAPKSDAFLRRRWSDAHPDEMAQDLRQLSAGLPRDRVSASESVSVRSSFTGISIDMAVTPVLRHKIELLDDIGIDDLAILFDDMRGDLPALARAQVDVIDFAAAHTEATRIIVAPTYYADDPKLDRLYGQRPENYLQDLGRMLDPAVEVFWTGPEVCSREFTPGHLARVGEQLHRKPFVWDNYPVNDGPRMSQHLHLRAFTGRPAAIGGHVAGHAVNPASQPTLSLIPALTLAASYTLGRSYDYRRAFEHAATEVLGPELAARVAADLYLLADRGLDNLGDDTALLRARYEEFDHPAAREIVAWLDGTWRITREKMEEV